MALLSQDSLMKLKTVHPALQSVLRSAVEIVPFQVVEGHRSEEDQEADFAAGKTQLHWPNGKHNAVPSLAVDVAPLYYDRGVAKIDWSDLIAFGRLMGVIQAVAWKQDVTLRFGLDWDSDFHSVGRDPDESFLDAPHIEVVNRT